jgi:hypothetical protein
MPHPCPRRPRTAVLRLARALPLPWVALLAACATSHEEIAPPDTTPPVVAIRFPLPESAVADTVRVETDASDDTRVRRVTLLVDGVACGTCYVPPWVVPWVTDPLPDSSFYRLVVEGVDEAGNSALSAPCRVCVRRNEPPVVSIGWPEEKRWIELDAPAHSWNAEATDPDEGPLGDERIAWFLDGQPLAQTGRAIPSPDLTEGAHTIRVRTADRWGCMAQAIGTIVAFRYPGGSDPGGALQSYLCALRARDPLRAAAALDDGFRSHPPGALEAGRWDASREGAALQTLLEQTDLRMLSVEARLGPAEIFSWGGVELAKIEITPFEVQACLQCAAGPGSPARGQVWRVAPSTARVFLRRDGAAGDWRIAAWWDLHGATWCPGAGPSWSALKRAAQEAGLCP